MLFTTKVTVERTDGSGDPYEAAAASKVARRVPAHISSPRGNAFQAGGDKEVVDAVAYLPSRPRLQRSDTLVDETTGDSWSVMWTRWRHGLGLDHQTAGVNAVRGESNG